MRARAWPAAMLSLILLSAACGGEEAAEGGGEEGGGTIQVAGEEASDHGAEEVTGAEELEVELDDFYFEPTVLEGEAGQPLTLSLFNEGEAPHTFTIDAHNIDEELQPGDQGVTVDVTFPDSGALLFYCRFHAAQGMRGGLSVGGDLSAAPGSGAGGGTGDTEEGAETDPGGGGYQGPGY